MELLGVFAAQAALAIEAARMVSDLGRVLLAALADAAADGGGLGRALTRAAEDADGPDPDLAGLAACFFELGHAGEEERRAATRLLEAFVAYTRRRRR